MTFTLLGLVCAASFFGAAFYINWAEQPARLTLDDAGLLKQWKPSYARGYQMQASLAVIAALLGLAGYFAEHRLGALAGGVLMAINWPYTLLVIMPTNKKLEEIEPAEAGPAVRALVLRWASLHAVRTGLGAAATLAFLAALLA